METDYVKTRDKHKRAMRIWSIFLPVWLVSWVFTLILSEELANNHATLSMILKYLFISIIISIIPVLFYFLRQIRPYYGPWVKCENCKHDAIKWTALGHKYYDVCPNCGNDNTEPKT